VALKLRGMRLPQSIFSSFSVRNADFQSINVVIAFLCVVPFIASANAQLSASPSSLRFGALDVGQTETLLITLTNNGATSVTISALSASNPEFSASGLSLPATLLAGETLDLSVNFSPNATGWTSGTIKFTSNASNPTLVVSLGGGGVTNESATASPAALSFGWVATGGHSALPVVITNSGSKKVTLSSISVIGSQYSVSGATFPLTLSVGQSVSLSVTFAPQSSGEFGGSVFVYGPRLNIPLTGSGTSAGQLILAPATLNFGNVPVGTTQNGSLSMTASGGSVTVYSAANGNSQFALEGASFPFTITSGQSVSLNVGFDPQKIGVQSASLSFTSNASNPLAVESLTGTGTAVVYTVNIWWNSSQNVEGYNIYRSTAANGTYAKINSTLEANTAYTDNTVASGQTYYYEATSVNYSGEESVRSTPPVQAVVP
jgi:hypothetical protein